MLSTAIKSAEVGVWIVVEWNAGRRHRRTQQASSGPYGPFTYKSVPHSSGGDPFAHLCNAGSGPVDPLAVPWGWWYTIYKYDTATGALVGEPNSCACR